MNPFSRTHIHFSGQKRSALDMARTRLVLLNLFFIITYIIVVVRIVELTVIQGEMKKGEEKVSYLEKQTVVETQAPRADILDRNGVLLARSIKTASLFADPYLINDPPNIARHLVKIFPDLVYGDVLKKLQENNRFSWIKRNITPDEQYKILYLGEPGLGFKQEFKRVYPQGTLSSHILGYTNVDDRGLSGLEAGFDKILSAGRDPLVTTLDIRFQHTLRREMDKTIQKFSAIGGAGMIMDVKTGEILAATSLPDFDPQKASSTMDADARFNRLTLGVFEPGSTFKIFTTAATLELKQTPIEQAYDAREALKVGRFSINDFHAQKRILSLPEVFMHSSNIGSVKMAQDVGTEEFQNFLRDLGLLNAPSLEIPEIGAPLVPSPWRDIHTMTASYGHGIAISPLQLVSAASSIMNGGLLVKPTLVLDKKDGEDRDESRVRVVSEKTAHRMRQLMRLVVTQGTGGGADVPGYNVGGKTGTADKNEGGRYSPDKRRASFLAFYPIEEPRYAVYIMIDEPKGIKETFGYATAGWVAAPAVKKVIESLIAIEGMKPQPHDDLADALLPYIKTKEQLEKEKKLASFSAD